MQRFNFIIVRVFSKFLKATTVVYELNQSFHLMKHDWYNKSLPFVQNYRRTTKTTTKNSVLSAALWQTTLTINETNVL